MAAPFWIQKLHKVFNSFLAPFKDDSIEIQKKMRYLLTINLIILFLYVFIFAVRIFIQKPSVFIYLGDACQVVTGILILYFIRKGDALNAVNCIFGIFFTVFFQKIMEEYSFGGVRGIDKIYETITTCLSCLLFLSILSIHQLQNLIFSIVSALVVTVNYFVLVEKYYKGIHTDYTIQFLLSGVFLILVIGVLSFFSFSIYRKLTKSAQLSIESSNKKYEALFMNLDDGFAFHRVIGIPRSEEFDFEYLEVNRSYEETFGVQRESLIGHRFDEVKGALHFDLENMKERFRTVCFENREDRSELYSEQNKKWIEVYAYSPIENHFVTFVKEITDSKQLQESIELGAKDQQRLYGQLKEKSSKDGLTEINNRFGFTQRFIVGYQKAILKKDRIALFMIDIDHFKKINDNHGHLVGDRCLKAVAKELSQSLYRSADVVARYGGEEFIVFLQKANLNDAIRIAERMRENIEKLNIPEIPRMTISVGVLSCVSHENYTLDHLIGEADRALYRAKERGRNRVESINFGKNEQVNSGE